MAKQNNSMADNLPGNIVIGPTVSGDSPGEPVKASSVYEPEVATDGGDYGGQPIHGYKRITVPPRLVPSMEKAVGGDLSHENPARCMADYYQREQMSYLGHFAGPEVMAEGHNTSSHPGFKAVQAKIESQGYSAKAAGAILASKTRHASSAAKKANPRLKRVKG